MSTRPQPTGTAPVVVTANQGPSAARKAVNYLVLIVLAVFFIAPILYMFIGSLKPADKVLNGLAGFIPESLSLDNYAGVFARFNSEATGYFYNFYLTSLIVSVVIVIGGLVVNSMAAYAFARLRWRGRDAVMLAVILLVIVPFEAIAVPLFYLLNGSRNTYYVQFIPFVANALSIYLFYTFFVGLPKQLDEAARVDGAGPWRTFLYIIVPMSKPVFASVTILTFLSSWGSFLWPVMMTDQPRYRPLPLEISVFQGQPPTDWGQIFAFGVMFVLPLLIVFLVFQRWFVQSVASSGLKG
ncbi:carbohydrate ABC transporter membrane protein 2 (CUT1 family) [Humibacillus xanthopallidus]|uniref:Carbohydrate ABC transporter membrane protein 2 (CUT1 family) n=1 Tax=Humibacillus xanthopallidus TaxID=412689 RepID=A0A543PLX3_9MICO|nr:carbohydrate ABC transporter permease [Humibacillus xanthopallidus]TQN45068.1 carbohydrate ABC transporter membrane protein 2 (CUT1 family) [Humibacillus xanthopallidus]